MIVFQTLSNDFLSCIFGGLLRSVLSEQGPPEFPLGFMLLQSWRFCYREIYSFCHIRQNLIQAARIFQGLQIGTLLQLTVESAM